MLGSTHFLKRTPRVVSSGGSSGHCSFIQLHSVVRPFWRRVPQLVFVVLGVVLSETYVRWCSTSRDDTSDGRPKLQAAQQNTLIHITPDGVTTELLAIRTYCTAHHHQGHWRILIKCAFDISCGVRCFTAIWRKKSFSWFSCCCHIGWSGWFLVISLVCFIGVSLLLDSRAQWAAGQYAFEVSGHRFAVDDYIIIYCDAAHMWNTHSVTKCNSLHEPPAPPPPNPTPRPPYICAVTPIQLSCLLVDHLQQTLVLQSSPSFWKIMFYSTVRGWTLAVLSVFG